ncbi:MAG: TlpA family protein disulfide reductase [Burkholderiales bacterium]|nr:TlpA family protein disulfide reductase [Burkholderiales bacterium]
MRWILAGLATFLSTHAAAVEAGMPAPALSMAALEASAPAITMAGLKGSVVYVDFWASWCVPCRLSMPALDELYRRNKSRGFAVVGVNKDATPADARRFLAKVPVTFPLVQDAADAAARGFDVKAMPSGYLVDRKGVVRHVHRGFTAETGATLAREIDLLLKEPS